MSFAAQTKKELTMIESEPCCEKAELSALIRMLGAVQLSNKKVILAEKEQCVYCSNSVHGTGDIKGSVHCIGRLFVYSRN